jgi:hypothetical protein
VKHVYQRQPALACHFLLGCISTTRQQTSQTKHRIRRPCSAHTLCSPQPSHSPTGDQPSRRRRAVRWPEGNTLRPCTVPSHIPMSGPTPAKRPRNTGGAPAHTNIEETLQQAHDCALLLQSLMAECCSADTARLQNVMLQNVRSIALAVASKATQILADSRQQGGVQSASRTPLGSQQQSQQPPAAPAVRHSPRPAAQPPRSIPPTAPAGAQAGAPSTSGPQPQQPPQPPSSGVCTVCAATAPLAQNSNLYRVCGACIALGSRRGTVLPRCPRSGCGATHIFMGKKGWHFRNAADKPHYITLEAGVFTAKFSNVAIKRKASSKKPSLA